MEWDLLTVLDALVQSDRAPPGFRGTIAVGVRAGEVERWWVATAAESCRAKWVLEPPDGADVTILLGENAAQSVLSGERGVSTRSEVWLKGNVDVWERFVARYVDHRSMLELRAELSSKASPA